MSVLQDSTDLFVFREEPLVAVEDEFGPSFFILLKNFPLNSNVLRAEHTEVLRERVVPFVKQPVGFAEIYGMTDRSGSRKVNYKVSADRLAAVQRSLIEQGAAVAKVFHGFAKAIGEDFFEARNQREGDTVFRDNAKNADFRVVVVALTPAPIGVPTRFFRQATIADTVSFCRAHVQRP